MNVLFLATWYPYPPDNGSRLRSYYLLQGLAHKHRVTLIALYDADQTPADSSPLHEWCQRVIALPRRAYVPNRLRALTAFLSSRPRYLVDTFDPSVQDTITRECAGERFDVVIANQLSMAAYAAALPPRIRIFDEVEVGIFQDAFLNARGLARGRNALTWHKFSRYLRQLAAQFMALTVVSEQERTRLGEVGVDGERVHVVPNGVDCAAAQSDPRDPEPFTLIYNGAVTYHANLDAVRFMVNDILPLVRAVEPRARLKITGRADQVAQNELSRDNVVLFTGYVDDIRAVVRSSAICVVPLRVGGGTRLKILEAMSLGVPVVATRKGAEGLGLTDKVHLLLADTPQEFATAVLALLQNADLCERLSHAARERVCQEFDWREIQGRFDRVLQSVSA
ncbi:MAG: glycosyltransferase [Anaerolineae bacterium]|nr:glycosyltransferase [Anaerolineae bacterium]